MPVETPPTAFNSVESCECAGNTCLRPEAINRNCNKVEFSMPHSRTCNYLVLSVKGRK